MKIYIAGKINGNKEYKQQFEAAMNKYKKKGYTVLNPAILPEGMTNAEYMKICFPMINVANKVVFLSGYEDSRGAMLEKAYCEYIGKRFSIDAIPAAAIEDKRAEWIYHKDDLFPEDSTQECSLCHAEEFLSLLHENYCPNCGAKMDGTKEG